MFVRVGRAAHILQGTTAAARSRNVIPNEHHSRVFEVSREDGASVMNAEYRTATSRERRPVSRSDTPDVGESPRPSRGNLVVDPAHRRNDFVRSWEALQRKLRELDP